MGTEVQNCTRLGLSLAKLGDFGLARLVDHARASRTTDLAGTRGYIDLGCVAICKASKELDVYSFGIVALELSC